MNQNSFEWFQQQARQVQEEIDHWPDWMRNSLDVATASFPQVHPEDEAGTKVQSHSAESTQKHTTKK